MKYLIPLLAFNFLIGCDGEKSNETKNPNLKYRMEGDEVTITGCDTKASGDLIIPAKIEGKTVTGIRSLAFYDCKSLTKITIPDGVTSIELEAFRNCTSLTSITIGNGVTSIGGFSFEQCTKLTSITIPDGVTSIGDYAFHRCISLTNIKIPDSVTNIGVSAFAECTSLTTIEVGVENVSYADVNGVLFNKEKTLLHTYPAGKTSANYNIPDSVTSIGEGAFWRCKSLTKITIPDSVTSIGEGAFSTCTSLTSITIGNGVTSIGYAAFWNCNRLTGITIPDSVINIGIKTFYRCSSLNKVTFLGDAPRVSNDAFKESSPTIYRKADAKGWGDTFAGRPVKPITEKP